MAKKLDPIIGDILKKHGYGTDAVWDCHGTWVVYHNILEQIAAKTNVVFESPLPLEANGAAKSVAICVTGSLDGRTEWSIGEASPANCKNSYPYAMAEKRGKDRVILKLIGLNGLAYSEEEADNFKETPSKAPTAVPQAQTPPPSTPALTPEVWLKNAALDVKHMARDELDDFCSKQADRIARVRTLNPGPHKALVEAIKARYEVLA